MSFWKPGTVAPGSSIDREGASEGQGAITGKVVSNIGISERRRRLPIAKQRDVVLYALEQHRVVILQSPTGTGKSTQLPQYLKDAGWCDQGKKIAITQPRRIAAVSIAQRVAEEMGSLVGDEVGYAVRFESLVTLGTKIIYLTDGLLFRELLEDPLLLKYSVIMIDEAHERSMYTDLLLGTLKKILRVRHDLRVVISSATLDTEEFRTYFEENEELGKAETKTTVNDVAVVVLEGRSYPVEIAYLDEPAGNVVHAAAETVIDIHRQLPPGDILVFLAGREQIESCLQVLSDHTTDIQKSTYRLHFVPLFAGLSSDDQMRAFDPAPSGYRKVVLSTNIAEASVTIDHIKYVVDSGLVKLKSYNPRTGAEALVTTSCSQSSLAQRAGRAGRTSPGKCFRLFPQTVVSGLTKTTPPEITRSDLSLLILQLKALGIQNLLRFEYLTPPNSLMFERALEFLYCLGALNDRAQLTLPLGERMAELPIDVKVSKMLLESHEYGCSDEILTIAAMTSVEGVFITEGDSVRGELERRKFTAEEGDHLTYLNVYNAFVNHGRKSARWCHNHRLNFKALSRAISIRSQLLKYMQRFKIPIVSAHGDHTKIRRCLTSGYFRNAAQFMPDGTFRSVRENAILYPHPSSVLFTRTPPSPFVIYHEVIETTKPFIRDITSIDQEWLAELAPHYYSYKEANV